MKIYAAADLHANPGHTQALCRVIARYKPDVLVLAGDITRYLFPSKFLEQISELPIPVLGIRGNSDLKCVESLFKSKKNLQLLTHKPLFCQTLRFLGLNGTVPLPFLSKICFREAQALDRLKSAMTKETVLVVHPPPRGIRDKVAGRSSAGSFKLKRFIEIHSPLMVLCGHIHEQAGFQFLGRTPVINCAMNKTHAGAIIEVEKGMELKIKMILNDNPVN